MSDGGFDFTDRPTRAVGDAVNSLYLAPEDAVVPVLCDRARVDGDLGARIQRAAIRLVESVREKSAGVAGLDAFLQEYDLSSREGVALMCLAEALLRIPDAETADALIADKLKSGDWSLHSGESESLFVNAST